VSISELHLSDSLAGNVREAVDAEASGRNRTAHLFPDERATAIGVARIRRDLAVHDHINRSTHEAVLPQTGNVVERILQDSSIRRCLLVHLSGQQQFDLTLVFCRPYVIKL
jgi:hypothetical protein